MPARRRLSRADADAGFTLLEVLVAFAIAALALGVLFEGAVGGLRTARTADREEEALSRAQSHLAVVGHGVALRPTTQEGADGTAFRWRLQIVPLQSVVPSTGGVAAARLTLFRVVVTETWPQEGSEHGVVLRTERLGTAPGGGP